MDFTDTPEEHEFRAELRRWIEGQQPIPPIPEDDEGRIAYLWALQSRMHAAGLTALSFPVEYGGRGLPPNTRPSSSTRWARRASRRPGTTATSPG